MAVTEQLVTITAVILGGLTTHLTNALTERSRKRHQLSTRWDDKKLDAYASYVDRIRASIFLAVELYEHRTGVRQSERGESEIVAEMAEAGQLRGCTFERIMLLGGDEVVETAHDLNAVTLRRVAQAQPRGLPRGQHLPRGCPCGPGRQWHHHRRAAP
ncbi:hypothetical protein QZH56_16135 [Streptomyces olivoreticuli]|uniref:hypothetical protein n=1 Tax=Streptomyces olivoreticuli TaxID=68246 RepID=UPI00265A7B2C|nr:hypothetical protein [Streptomyces olivoreticuli]WKK26981.1 hypothetical protein QZH56_16135 [Streptomyces olivoreticuli]